MSLRTENINIYWAWKAMKQRCSNPKCKAYRNYGARGIKVCEEWSQFEPFLEWCIQNGYKKGLDLDRKNNNGDYTPENCRWISRKENLNNRRNTIHLTVCGKTLPETVWSEKIGVDRALIKYWLKTKGKCYAEERIKEALKNGYNPRNYSYGHKKSIRHVQTGLVFDSVKKAAEHFELAPCTISNAMRNGKTTGKGKFEWSEVE